MRRRRWVGVSVTTPVSPILERRTGRDAVDDADDDCGSFLGRFVNLFPWVVLAIFNRCLSKCLICF